MGYTTDFTGRIDIAPPLNPSEITYLRKFADTRHNKRVGGPYALSNEQFGPDVIDDWDHDGAPGYWCNWEPTGDGAALEWNGGEKFYHSPEWMRYLIDHFLKPGARAVGHDAFERFTFDHVLNGTIEAQGEGADDQWELLVVDNVVTARPA
ncbi:hypothetical protein ACIQGZ_17230 [Streptomyces sp. NPDC092296]|uniref:hypothetical protein n=1 Tax=Streptomyces sp. NPDC092296 TaxID=3366012 RepID=UPI003826BAA2